MKVAVVYNRESKSVINLFGTPNREKIGMRTIRRLTDALKAGGHEVRAIEGDKDLVDRLEKFMPRVVRGERPGMVFNVSYGIQGQARYTHVPSILEMVGIPYVASGPLAHSLALDKVVTKMILRQQGLPTPDFFVLQSPDDELPPDLPYPMIVKPKNEAVSFGLAVVQDEAELREGAGVIFDKFRQAVLAEQYIEGREINVGLLGNNPPEAFAPVELQFGEGGPKIYTYEDKTGRSGREIMPVCPADIPPEVTARAQDIAKKAFVALECYDCARVDMRLDGEGNLFILEINSLPSLGEHGSYLVGAAHGGLDFTQFVNRLLEVASARYFGTPEPPQIEVARADPATHVVKYITQRRDRMERRLREWTDLSSRTTDPVGIQQAVHRAEALFGDLGMKPVPEFVDPPETYMWETRKGFAGGMLFVGHLDTPVGEHVPSQPFRRDPEWLHGDGIGTSRAPLVMLEFALRALRSIRRLRHLPLGVLLYTDEGRDAQHSDERISKAAELAKHVIVLHPGTLDNGIVTQRRGYRKFRLVVLGEPLRPGRSTKRPAVLRWLWNKLEDLAKLSSAKNGISVDALDVRAERHSTLLPHRASASVLLTYRDMKLANQVESEIRNILRGTGPKVQLTVESDRPPMRDRAINMRLAKALMAVAEEWDIPLRTESSTRPSVAGLVPSRTGCVCGAGPVAQDLGTPHEAVQRISLIQRTLLLGGFLAKGLEV
jgi:D-alanine-D-alanine ligase